jgi:serine/threonine protein kinase/tetratricopeptide (TPR) repeat protein
MPDEAQSLDFRIGLKFSHYRIIEEIGSGGMGVVYRAHDGHLDREVAVKVLIPRAIIDEAAHKHLRKEARALSKLNYPNIATIYDFDTQKGVDFLVMEFIPGITLREKLAAGPLPEREVLRLGIELAEGLAAAHEHGIVHRDLKPSNLRITSDGRLKILDFGLAQLRPTVVDSATAESLSETRAMAGTLPYMAPEQLSGEDVDARTDIHGAGFVLYEMATGQRPFAEVWSSQLISALMRKSPIAPRTLNPRLSAELERIIEKCLEKEAENRYQSAKELAIDLRRLLTPSVIKVTEDSVVVRTPWKVLVPVALVLVASAIGGTLYFRSRQATTRLTDKDTIVLSDFDNKTGDPVFDDTLKQGLSVQLEQSPFLDLVSERKVNDTLKLMGQPAGGRLTPEITHEVCQRTGGKAMLIGSIAGFGSHYVIGLKAVNCNSGDVLAELQEEAAGKEAVLKTLDDAAVSLRSKLGESLGSVQKYATPVEEATTPSLEALKAYSLGRKRQLAKGETASLPFYKRAVELDPNFAMAYQAMASVYGSLNEAGRAANNARKAYELREKVSERERFFVETGYYRYVTGELEKAAQTYDLWQQIYPRGVPYGEVAFISGNLGNLEKAFEECREAMRLEPDNYTSYANLGYAYTILNRLDEAEAVYKSAEQRKLESEALLQYRYQLAFLKGDTAQMARMFSAAMGKPGTEDVLIATQADTEGWYGKLRKARELTLRAIDLARHNDAEETAAAYEVVAALREVESGNRNKARTDVDAALKLAPNRDVRAIAALVLARASDTAGAEKLAAELDKTFPLDTLVQTYWLPSIRAGVALEHKDPKRAVELLKVASTIELGQPTNLTIFLCPAYLRGEAYLMLHDGKAAASEFQKFIDHRGLVANFPWGMLARLGMARAYIMMSDTVKARAAYEDFLTLWKDADPDIPAVVAAKSEYAKLK